MRAKIAKGEECPQSDKLYHYCDQCGQRFATLKGLRRHTLTVHEKVKFPCPSCSMTFGTQEQRREHQIVVHSTDARFQCKHCNYRSALPWRLRDHEQTHEERKFQCQYCPLKLRTAQSLREHERQHTGEKPFKCSVCESAFASKSGLNQHMRGTHKIAGPGGGKTGWVYGSKKK